MSCYGPRSASVWHPAFGASPSAMTESPPPRPGRGPAAAAPGTDAGALAGRSPSGGTIGHFPGPESPLGDPPAGPEGGWGAAETLRGQSGPPTGHRNPSFSLSLEVDGGGLDYDRVVSDLAAHGLAIRREASSPPERWALVAYCPNEAAMPGAEALVRAYFGPRLRRCADRVLEAHAGGKLRVALTVPLDSREDLALAYMPAGADAARAVARGWAGVDELSGRANTIAIVTDGSAVLGLGDLGPSAALAVMEGKAVLFRSLADISALPICLDATAVEDIVSAVSALAPSFAGINLEDIASPRCFAVERQLIDRLGIPVFHDDQHGTAVVVLAALTNALAVVGKRLEDARIVISGAGAAGTAVTRLLVAAGAADVVVWAPVGVLHPAENHRLPPHKRELAALTNPRGVRGGLAEAVAGADAFVGVSGPRVLTPQLVATMAPGPVVFALANPVPEVLPEQLVGLAAVVATGRSDYPNQINNVLVFPGLFRGLLDAGARLVTHEMKLEAARALASLVPPAERGPERILPEALDPAVVAAVAAAVAGAAAPVPPPEGSSAGWTGAGPSRWFEALVGGAPRDVAASAAQLVELGLRVERRGPEEGLERLRFFALDETSLDSIRTSVERAFGDRLVAWRDRAPDRRGGGLLRIEARRPLASGEDLALVYTPGVGRVASRIATDPAAAAELTGRARTVAIVGDGSEIPGCGHVPPHAALPFLEGLAAAVGRLGGVDAVAVAVERRGVQATARAIAAAAPSFGAVVLAGMATPRGQLVAEVVSELGGIAVVGDWQAMAVAAGAAVLNAVGSAGLEPGDARGVIRGADSASVTLASVLVGLGFGDVVLLHRGRVLDGSGPESALLVRALGLATNRRRLRGGLEEAAAGAAVLIDLEGGVVPAEVIAAMAPPRAVLLLSASSRLAQSVRPSDVLLATRSPLGDHWVDPALVLPGLVRGLLAGAPPLTSSDLQRLARALARAAKLDRRGRIVPDPFDPTPTAVLAGATGGYGAMLEDPVSGTTPAPEAPTPGTGADRGGTSRP